MDLRITKDVCLIFTGLSILMLFIGVFLSTPIQFSWSEVKIVLDQLSEFWLRFAIIFVLLGAVSLVLKNRNIVIAEYVGSAAFLTLLYPSLSILSGLPADIGTKGVLIPVGALFLVSSLSALLSVAVLNIQSQSDTNQA